MRYAAGARHGSDPNGGQARRQLRPSGRSWDGHGDYRPPRGDGSDSAVLSGRAGAAGFTFSESGIAEGSA